MPKPHILINGGGIAGPVCAYWLARAGIITTIIERSQELRKTGQQIDVRGAALSVVKRMNLEETSLSTRRETNRVAEFPVDEKGGMSSTSDIEILRGELSQIFYDVTKGTTEYVFGDYFTAIQDEGEKVKVRLSSGKEREFDLVIGADGMNFKTRRLAFPDSNPVKGLGQYTAFFTIPYKESKGGFAEWYNSPGGRCVFLRPDNAGYTRAYLSIMGSKPEGYQKMSAVEQKKMFRELFTDVRREGPRVLDGMDKAEDFYMQEIAQVKMDSWHHGRVALIGDAGYCTSPISDFGTSLAITGAYVLAGELGACKGN